MMSIIFLIVIAISLYWFADHLLQGDLSNSKDGGGKFLETLEWSLSRLTGVNQTSSKTRRAEMESAFGTPWPAWNPETSPDTEFDRPARRIDYLQRFFGPMDMEVAGDQVLIYDMQLGHAEIPDNAPSIFQTVISIKPPELRLPPFVLLPKLVLPSVLFRGKTILTETALDKRYTLESTASHRAKALFQSELGNSVLIPFLNEHKWIVQWTGKCLIVYELNRLIAPESIAEAALEVSEFFELLKSGPAVIDQGINDLIQETINQTNTTSEIGLKRL